MPHMKAEDAKRVMERHRKTLTASTEERKPQSPALSLLDGFRAHGLAIVEQPTAKRSA